MKYRLTSDEEEEEVKSEGEEDEDSASVLQVAIPGDGDCFYSAIVEAFLRDGVDIVALFTGRMGCEVQYLFKHLSCHQKRQEAILSESAPPPLAQATDSGVKCLRRAVAFAITPQILAFLQENYQVLIVLKPLMAFIME